ncbi:MAG TPA: response regulator [Dehalococcoidia bacterium]|nr:response regulator [Dehalococcoidia bacterium]
MVEDDAAIGHMLITLLGAEGYRPVLVADGALALEAARAERPAVITLDLSLPNVDGLEILDRLDESAAGWVPVVVVSAYTKRLTDRHRERAAAVIEKPFEVETLLRSIARAIGRT